MTTILSKKNIKNDLQASSYSSKVISSSEIKAPTPNIEQCSSIKEMIDNSHPLIHAWLILSSLSICFLTALLFVIH